MNFVFISPQFPPVFWQFCNRLQRNGVTVLGIGDAPYDGLAPELKSSLTEYYYTPNLADYSQVFRAVAFFSYKYGKIDWLESNNEYWLEKDAQLRTDFNITSGFQTKDISFIKFKSKMKEFYKKAKITVARYHLVKDLAGCRKFIKKVGYPVVVKPDNGVGAAATYKLTNDEELVNFINEYPKEVPYIMEEFLNAQVNSYDAIIDSNGDPIFETGNVTLSNLMEVVINKDDSIDRKSTV